ncbi:MAG TPA: LON peptidase substrate-binding domain-containing protein [Lacunisphaera sp.]|jgi:ATP-dependent Lon protease|nr:LON peptidase substrate-binding domain-containing protein [Lacunisphaera sp.]
MEQLQVPATVPVMTLPNTVFFPQALLPLHIFEPRYRQMLRDVLAADRLFAVGQLDTRRPAKSHAAEPLHPMVSVGVIRACQKGEQGTSDLLLQGVCRAAVVEIVREAPYRVIRIAPVPTTTGAHQAELEMLRLEVMRLLNLRRRLGTPAPKGMTQFLESIEDIDTFADVAAFNMCEDGLLKQRLLETVVTRRRLEIFAAALKREIEMQRLRRRLQGPLPDDGIANN